MYVCESESRCHPYKKCVDIEVVDKEELKIGPEKKKSWPTNRWGIQLV